MCVFVCFFCPLRITGMGNQWVQRLSLILQQGVNAACHLLLRECDYDIVHFSNLQLLQSCCLFTQLSSLSCPTGQSHAIRGRWRAFIFIRFMLIQYHACVFPLLSHIFKLWPFLPLRVWNMNLNLLFIAFACCFFLIKKKNRHPCSCLTGLNSSGLKCVVLI